MAVLKLKIYDDGGETIDRYTMIMPDGEAWGFSENPYHPQGVGQYVGNLSNLRTFSHLGKPVKSIMDLPEQARKFVDEIATESGDTYVIGTAARPSGKSASRKVASRKSSGGRKSSLTSIRRIGG